jgi:trans-AT polyketide synthase, acyltransferase and oxidoreductase domains
MRAAHTSGSEIDRIKPESLGSARFKSDYGVRFAYMAGSMYKAIASERLVCAMARARMLSFFGCGGLSLDIIEKGLRTIQANAGADAPFGANLLCNFAHPALDDELVDLYIRLGIRVVEASGFLRLTPALIRYRIAGLTTGANGEVIAGNRVIAKLSNPELAAAFMRPPPEEMVRELVEAGAVSKSQATLCLEVPVADDICVESDSAGHTDRGVALVLLPTIIALRDGQPQSVRIKWRTRIGAAGGLGTPASIAAAFILGADFVLTGSINQCTVEAGTSDAAKRLLQGAGALDTTYAPAGDLFEVGAEVQVLRHKSVFALNANRLFELYRRYGGWDEIDAVTQADVEKRILGRSFNEVLAEVRAYATGRGRAFRGGRKAEMARVFKWYLAQTVMFALEGRPDKTAEYQIHCGPALGAFNQHVAGTPLAQWRNRYVAEIGELLMRGAANTLSEWLHTRGASCSVVAGQRPSVLGGAL